MDRRLLFRETMVMENHYLNIHVLLKKRRICPELTTMPAVLTTSLREIAWGLLTMVWEEWARRSVMAADKRSWWTSTSRAMAQSATLIKMTSRLEAMWILMMTCIVNSLSDNQRRRSTSLQRLQLNHDRVQYNSYKWTAQDLLSSLKTSAMKSWHRPTKAAKEDILTIEVQVSILQNLAKAIDCLELQWQVWGQKLFPTWWSATTR